MSKTILFGGSGFLGPVILKKNPDIISIGRTKPPLEIKNEHIHLKSLDNLQSVTIDVDTINEGAEPKMVFKNNYGVPS